MEAESTTKKKKKNPFAGMLSTDHRSGKLITRITAPLSCISKRSRKWYHQIKVYQKLRAKGIQPQIKHSDKIQTCKNCRIEFTGNYCSNCGQKAKIRRLNFRSFIESLLGGITNVSSGFLFTIINLFSRPGYLLNDYIRGKRVVYTTPFQLLFVTAAIFAVTSQILHPKFKENEAAAINKTVAADSLQTPASKAERLRNITLYTSQLKQIDSTLAVQTAKKGKLSSKDQTEIKALKKSRKTILKQIQHLDPEESEFDFLKSEWNKWGERHPFLRALLEMLQEWFASNRAIVEVTIIPFIALATKWAFRKSKVNPHLNFIETVFITTFISCQILIVSLFALLFNVEAPGIQSFWLRLALSFWMFRELFRNSYWMTFRKTFRALYLTILIILLISVLLGIAIAIIISLLKQGPAGAA